MKIKILLLPILLLLNLTTFSQKYEWAKIIGGIDQDHGTSIAIDLLGNIYTTGSFSNTIDVDPGGGVTNLTSVGDWDIFILKLDSSGNFLWAKQIGGTGMNVGYSLVVDDSGNVYTTGRFAGTADFDPGPGTINLTSSGSYDIFVLKLDKNGNFKWAKQIGGTGYDSGNSIVVDDSGNVSTIGSFAGTADFNPGPGTTNLTSAGLSDIFVQKLNKNGNLVWAKQMRGTDQDDGNSLVVDDSGNIYAVGRFEGSADFNPDSGITNLISSGSHDIFVQKLNKNGNLVWAKQMGGENLDNGSSITIDISDNVYTTGSFWGTVDFDPGLETTNLTSIKYRDIFVQKLDNSGKFLWAKQMGGVSSEEGYSITVDASKNIFTTGSFGETVDFDPGPGSANLTSGGIDDIFILKMSNCFDAHATINQIACEKYASPSGNYIWTSSNTYLDTISNSFGCDSVITINLTINIVDTSITQTGTMLTANATGATYQWLNCKSAYSVINGEINKNFKTATNGNYAVKVTQNGCTDTSNCYNITGVGFEIHNHHQYRSDFLIFPNPFRFSTTIYIPSGYKNLNNEIIIKNIFGQEVKKISSTAKEVIINRDNLSSGIYFYQLRNNNEIIGNGKLIVH